MIVVKEREAALKTILPQLHAFKFDSGQAKPNIRTYIGLEEVKNIYDDIIDTKHHMMAVVSWDDAVEFLGKEFMADFVERRAGHFLKLRLITPKTALSQTLKQKDSATLRQTKFLPEHIALRRISNFIYGDKVANIIWREKTLVTIIEDKEITGIFSSPFIIVS